MMFERLKNLWKGIRSMFAEETIKSIAGGNVELTETMIEHIELWNEMITGQFQHDKKVTSLGIESGICREFADISINEMELSITNDRLQELFDKCIMDLNENLQHGLALGSFLMRPLGDASMEFVSADNFIPIKYAVDGSLLDCILLERRKVGVKHYTRAERHSIVNGYLVIQNKAYVSSSYNHIGRECDLSEINHWSTLPEEIAYPDMPKMDLGYYRNPLKNKIDGSKAGISIFHTAIGLIKKADTQGARLEWEYESGERAIHVDARALNHKGKMAKLGERLYRGLDLDAGKETELLKEYSPEYRDANLIHGLEEYYRQIEFNVGLSYGDLSNCQQVDKTATEILTAKARKYNRVTAIQNNLKDCLEDFIDALAFYTSLYTSGYEVSCVFHDSILTDEETERKQDREDVAMGVMPLWEYRMKWYKEEEEQAKSMIVEQNTVIE